MPVPPPIATNGRFFPPQSALYRIKDGNLYSRKIRNAMLLSINTTTPREQCILAAPLANLRHARWFRSLCARVWLDEDADTLPAELHVVCTCPQEILARMNNDELASGAALQDLCEDTVLFALKSDEIGWQPVRVVWAEVRRDGLTAWCCLEPVQ